MKALRRFAYILYPLLIFGLLPFMLIKNSQAGNMRTVEVSPSRSAHIRLAFGRTTAISFFTRPEKVVPGSPGAIEVNFLGKDITVRPLSSKPGNLLVYTKTGRYVLLLDLASDASYDDVVEVTPGKLQRISNLSEQTYRVAELAILPLKSKVALATQVPVRVLGDGYRIEGSELSESLSRFPLLSCPGCTFERRNSEARISCRAIISNLKCTSKTGILELRLEGLP